MNFKTKTAPAVGLLTLCAAMALATAADARPKHRHVRHHAIERMPAANALASQSGLVFNNDGKAVFSGPATAGAMSAGFAGETGRRAERQHSSSRRVGHSANAAPATGIGFGSSSLVSTARNYLGTNPTGRRSLWCGAFMDLVLKKTGHAGGGNLAKGYARYGRRVSGPQVGAIAVMNRRGGGHVGVVSGIDANGNPIIISGNHNRTVAESVYPAGRITAYVVPN